MKNILKQAENAERLLKLTSDTMLLLNRDGICMDIAVHNVNLWFMKEEAAGQESVPTDTAVHLLPSISGVQEGTDAKGTFSP